MTKNLLRSFATLKISCRQYSVNSSIVAATKCTPYFPVPASCSDMGIKFDPRKNNNLPLNFASVAQKEYTLPGAKKITTDNIAILDPLMNITEYKLPTIHTPITEKVTPPQSMIVPIEDPSPAKGEEKIAGPWLVRIRRKMHKKHQLQKRKARNLFLNRRLNHIKHMKKMAKIEATERDFEQIGKDFNPELHIEMQRKLARFGGYKVDILQEYNEARQKQA